MNIQFIGAARCVTGSCTLIECNGRKLLVDCGMSQGADRKQMDSLLVSPHEIDAVLLTHAHIDHSGWLPLLVKEGYKGPIWATGATRDLSEIMLADSGHIQEMEAEWRNRKAKRSGKRYVEPLYTVEDAVETLPLFRPVEYGDVYKLFDGITFRFTDAGHLLGSAFVELWLEEEGVKRKLVMSGDVGNLDQPLIKDPQPCEGADVLVIESTYGNRLHKLPKGAVGHNVPTSVRARELAEIIEETFDRGGNVIIPAFSVGRTQEILYLIRNIISRRLCEGYKRIPVYVDSPLSVKATGVFAGNIQGYFDAEAMELVNKGINPLTFPSLVTVTDVEQSKALNFMKEPKVIISSSGMCDAGRIRHHLKHNLWRSECTVVFTGFQARGTVGRSIIDGARHVTLFGEQVDVNCEVRKLEGISGHADRDSLTAWIESFKKKPDYIFVNHGEADSALAFSSYLQKKFDIPSYAPEQLESFSLADLSSLPRAAYYDPTKLPYYRHLQESVQQLKKEQKGVENLLECFYHAAGNSNIEAKDAIRLTNAVERLASDMEFLCMKWNSDVK